MSLGDNIRSLRLMYGEKVEDLAFAIGCRGTGQSTISQYESGARKPRKLYLERIAKHYHVSEAELVYGDFSHLVPMHIHIPKEWDGKFLERLFPVFIPDDADEHLRRAAEIQKRFMYLLCSSSDDTLPASGKELDEAIHLSEEGPAKWANELSLTFTFVYVIRGSEGIPSDDIMMLEGDIPLSAIAEDCSGEPRDYDPLEDIPEDVIKGLRDEDSYILTWIRLLSRRTEWRQLAEYYNALRYIFHVGEISGDPGLSRMTGWEMIRSAAELGNRYAAAFLREMLGFFREGKAETE